MKNVGKGCFGCFGIIGIIVVGIVTIAIFAFSGKSDSSKSSKTVPSSSLTSKESFQNNERATEKDSFYPTDTSDATIESIVTYANYLDMYELIVNEYITNYEAAVKQYGVGGDPSYQTMKEEVTATIEQQKQQYGPMKNTPIVGKEELVQFLKNYRDELKTYTDNIANGI
ncbi:hypothetical protein [Streptococcus pluranimalium]|uniref:hypothetical protein n=1 Tax=Streptococcus pluranimalium TaxID=82348 RepID=UPI0039FC8661